MESKNSGKNWNKKQITNWNEVDYFWSPQIGWTTYYHNWLRRMIVKIWNKIGIL